MKWQSKKGTPASCGNAGAVESLESQKQASQSFHEPLGNLAKGRRDFHISTAPATIFLSKKDEKPGPRGRASPSLRQWALRAH